LVAVRFTGSSVTGLAFVAATYTLSCCYFPAGRVVHHRKTSAMSNMAGDARRYPYAAAVDHCNDSVR
jgi:hypothetical protein